MVAEASRPRRRRRLRPTPLLRFVVTFACIGLFAALLTLASDPTYAFAALAAAVVLWWAIETGLLPMAIQLLLLDRARRAGHERSLWFVDVDVEQAAKRTEFLADTEDNPTLR